MKSKREYDAKVDETKSRLVSDFIGNTPFVKLSDKLYAKLESVNPGGSIKDRPVKWILDKSEELGLIQRNPLLNNAGLDQLITNAGVMKNRNLELESIYQSPNYLTEIVQSEILTDMQSDTYEEKRMYLSRNTIIEATSGNTGISLAMMGAERGYNIKIVMPCDMSEERKILLKMFGAELIEVNEGDFDGAIELKNKLVKDNGYFTLNQFTNPLNIECHYKTTFKELLSNSLKIGKPISAFISGTGTGGTLMGIQKGFSEFDNRVKIIAVEPTESPVMSGGEKGLHGIQGIGDGSKFLVDLDKVDEIITVSTKDAIERSKRLCKENGLFVGISSGANVLASERWIKNNSNISGIVFTILCDRGERYCSML